MCADSNVKYMEENLGIPLGQVLNIIQDRLFKESKYFGISTLKSPYDSWVYQEIIFEQKPDVIIEIGNYFGGSTLMLAHTLDLLGKGKVIGIDIYQQNVPEIVRKRPRVTLFQADACQIFDKVKSLIKNDDNVLIIEDSSHTYDNTLNVLRKYSDMIKPGGWFIVEDSICHHGLDVGPEPGPYEAIETFVAENKNFAIDRSKESFLITWNPKGYLKRKK